MALSGSVSNYVTGAPAVNDIVVINDFNGSVSASGTYPLGTTMITYTISDAAGNNTTCTQDVTVVDAQAPQITCPANLTETATSTTSATIAYVDPTGTDNCSGVTTALTAGLASGSTFPLGETTVTYTATDAAGLTADCSFTVTVEGAAPSILCPANVTVGNAVGLCEAVVTFSVTDNTGIPTSTITFSQAQGTAFPVGPTTVTATATNAVGSDACSFTVTV